MKIATFNINNINRRLANLLAWLDKAGPDIVCLQELKTSDQMFPAAALESFLFPAAALLLRQQTHHSFNANRDRTGHKLGDVLQLPTAAGPEV